MDTRVTPGLYRWPAEAYHADPCPRPSLSSTLAKLIIGKSPLHAWTASPRLNPNHEPDDRKTFDIGRAAHRAVLGAGGDYVAYPADILASNGAASTKEAKAWAEDQRAAGRVPLKAAEVDQIGMMTEPVHRRLEAIGITLDPRRSEMVAIAEIDGVWCRAMVDNAPADPRLPLVDFKTCEDARPEAVRAAVERYGYDIQAAHYLETWKAATGEDRGFVFVFQEKEPPFEVCVARLMFSPGHSEDWLEDAREKIATARATWRECLNTGIWPGYPALVVEIGATPWHRQRWQDTQSRAAVAREFSKATIARAAAWQSPE